MPEEKEAAWGELAAVIRQWNSSRLDLFEISPPDQNLEFHGVMRFYLEDTSGENVATKCLRVSSVWTTLQLIELLSEKIRPDLKMLSSALWLWEVQAGKERRLEPNERPLVVQLNWNKDNREGRFVLKINRDSKQENGSDKGSIIQNFKRTLSKKDKKKLKSRSTENSGSTQTEEEQGTGPSCLPVKVEFTDSIEDSFLSVVINYTNSSTVHFKLSPAFVLYAAARSLLAAAPSSASVGQGSKVAQLTDKMVDRLRRVIQKQPSSAGALCFWMSNCCELLHFLKRDAELQPITAQSQKGMSRLLHHAYRSLVQCLQKELTKHLPTFLLDPEIHGALPKGIESVLNTLMTSMSLLRRCKVHPALSIQLFSQLFHFISAWLFNRLLCVRTDPPALRSYHWGATLRHRLTPIEAWAERQGLELAADCHLALITQATCLLTMDHCVEVKEAQSRCFRLSPRQIRTLLQGYCYSQHQRIIPNEWVDGLVSAAQSRCDQSQDVPLEESLTLTLPLLLPEQGYCSQTLRGIPPGLNQFMEPACARGLCSLTLQARTTGDWTVHFSNTTPSTDTTYLEAQREPEVETVTLNKPLNSGMGLSIVAAKGAGQSQLGIYIKSIVKGGPAEMNGRVSCGDQLLMVDGLSLIGVSQESAVETLLQTGPVVTLEVAKHAAGFHGLEELLKETAPKTGTEHLNPVEVQPSVGLIHSSSTGDLSVNSRRQRDVKLQRNRQLYRSNPNILHLVLEEEEEEVCEPRGRGTKMAAHSTINLCSVSHYSVPDAPREYLTLPTPKNTEQPSARETGQHRYSRSTNMRQALSHENLLSVVMEERPLVDKRPEMQLLQRTPLRTPALALSSFPMRQSLSEHDLLSERPKHDPTPVRPAPSSSVQPIRIDIPLTRLPNRNPPLTTFQSPAQQRVQPAQWSVQPAQRSVQPAQRSVQLAQGSIQPAQRSVQSAQRSVQSAQRSVQSAQHSVQPTQGSIQPAQRSVQSAPLYDRPISGRVRPPGLCLGTRANEGRPRVNVTPSKHVSFQMDRKIKDEREGGEEGERKDEWRREEMEQQEEQKTTTLKMEQMEQEVRRLQLRSGRSMEESERLRRLSLELDFHRRLTEMEQREQREEEDEELQLMRSIQELEPQIQIKKNSGGNFNVSHQEKTQHSSDEKCNGLRRNVNNMETHQNAEDNMSAGAPEKLSFRERQKLFAPPSSA